MYLSSALIIGLLYSDVQEVSFFFPFSLSLFLSFSLSNQLQQNLEEQYTLSLSFSLDMFGILAFLNIAAYLKERAQFARESSSGLFSFSVFSFLFFFALVISFRFSLFSLLFSFSLSPGYYYTSAYYFSGFITSSLMFVLVVLIMCAMMYFLIGYPTQSWMAFLLYFTICYINLLTYQGIVEWLSATFTSVFIIFFLLCFLFLIIYSFQLSSKTLHFSWNQPFL